jgi:hypothetical protein
MRNTGFISAALVIAVGVATGISCSQSSGPGVKWNSFYVYGVYTDSTGAPMESLTVEATAFCYDCERTLQHLAVGRTDAAGHYSLQWKSNCYGDNPGVGVNCVGPIMIGYEESCGNFQLQCTDKPQERNCTLRPRF